MVNPLRRLEHGLQGQLPRPSGGKRSTVVRDDIRVRIRNRHRPVCSGRCRIPPPLRRLSSTVNRSVGEPSLVVCAATEVRNSNNPAASNGREPTLLETSFHLGPATGDIHYRDGNGHGPPEALLFLGPGPCPVFLSRGGHGSLCPRLRRSWRRRHQRSGRRVLVRRWGRWSGRFGWWGPIGGIG